jgi:nucleoside-diphosphate-sugar epimerase
MTYPIALILGATGNIGGAVARRLADRGWQVRALHRNPADLIARDGRFEWVRGDAMAREDVVSAARDAELIVHAVNPPGYRNWAGLVLPMIDNSIAAARAAGARILLPGTLYNFGPDVFPAIAEDAPQRPLTRKGRIRMLMEQRLEAAAAEGVPCLIVRAGDFFGSAHGNSWFSGAMIRPGRPLRRLLYPGRAGVGHQWAYVPDVAETMVRLIAKADRLPVFARYHMRGHWDPDGTRMIETLRSVAGHPVRVHRFPWWSLPVLGRFSEMFRELREMQYLWREPVRLTNDALLGVLGEEPHTPWNRAVQEALQAMNCL